MNKESVIIAVHKSNTICARLGIAYGTKKTRNAKCHLGNDNRSKVEYRSKSNNDKKMSTYGVVGDKTPRAAKRTLSGLHTVSGSG